MSICLEFLENYKGFIKNVKYKVNKETDKFYICSIHKIPKNKEGTIYIVKDIVS